MAAQGQQTSPAETGAERAPSVLARLGRGLTRIIREPYESGLAMVVRKEFADHLTGVRFVILTLLIAVTAMVTLYVASQTIRDNVQAAQLQEFVFLRLFTTGSDQLPPLSFFLPLLVPLVGLALGFDAVNGEEDRRTLSRLLSQPIHRDAVINGKFLAGLLTVALMLGILGLLVAGLGLRLIGVPPTGEEVARLLAFFAVTLLYAGFWLGLSVLFSVWFRQASTSALSGIAIWLFLSLFWPLVARLIASGVAPLSRAVSAQDVVLNESIQLWLSRLSPAFLYSECLAILLTPEQVPALMREFVLRADVVGRMSSALTFGQSLLQIWPQLVGLVAGMLVVFSISYVMFMRREVRA